MADSAGGPRTNAEYHRQLIIAVAIIFVVLIWHFRDVRSHYHAVQSANALCVFGAAASHLSGIDLSLTCVLGFVSLMKSLSHNGIILFDYAHMSSTTKKECRCVIQSRSLKERMRPIFLTSACASMGVVPMLLGGSNLWMPMAAVFGALSLPCSSSCRHALPAYWRFMQDLPNDSR